MHELHDDNSKKEKEKAMRTLKIENVSNVEGHSYDTACTFTYTHTHIKEKLNYSSRLL